MVEKRTFLGMTTAALVTLIIELLIGLVSLAPSLYNMVVEFIQAIRGELPEISVEEALERLQAMHVEEMPE